MVIWAKEETSFDLPATPLACFDHLGRAHPLSGKTLKVGSQPLYVLFAKGAHPKLKPPPERAKLLPGKPGSLVLQAVVPVEDASMKASAYFLSKGKLQKVPIFIYNFGSKMAKGKLSWTALEGWTIEMPPEVEIAPMERKELQMIITNPATDWTEGRIRLIGHFGNAGEPLLSLGFIPK
jgi:hypothetical protein